MSQQPSAYLAVGPYREILSGMLASLEVSEGIVKLTGRAGTGKTTLLEHLQRELGSRGKEVLFLSSAPASGEALDELIRRCFSLNENSSIHRALSDWLRRGPAPRRLVIIQDNAQELPDEHFLSLRLLANIQDDSSGLVQLVLAGTPLLDERLASPALRSLSQHLSQSFQLKPMTPGQVQEFCDALLAGSAMERHALDHSAVRCIHRLSGGVPGRVMQIWRQLQEFHELLPPVITARTLRSLVRDTGSPAWLPSPPALRAALLASLLLAALAFWFLRSSEQPPTVVSGVSEPRPASVNGEATPFREETAGQSPAAGEVSPEGPPAEGDAVAGVMNPSEAAQEAPAGIPAGTEGPGDLEESAVLEEDAAADAGGGFETADTEMGAARSASSPGDELTAFTDAWLESWARQDTKDYFSHYHAGFNPLYHASRDDWRADREVKISAPAGISLIYTDFEVVQREADRATVRFRLNYESPDYADLTWKELQLRRENGRWLIVVERNLETTILRA